MIVFKVNVVQKLIDAGYTTYKIRQNKILSEGTMTKLRNADTSITLDTINTLCQLLQLSIDDIIEYIPDNI